MKLGFILVLWCVGTSFQVPVDEEQILAGIKNELIAIESVYLNEIMKVALASDVGYAEANEVYDTKYGYTLVSVDNTSLPIIKDNVIKPDSGGSFLKAFGRSIKKLQIKFEMIPETLHWTTTKLVSDYCSETLLMFQVSSCKSGAFETVTQPFKMVEVVVFDGEWTDAGTSSWTFDKLFPKVHALELRCTGGNIKDIYNNNYKHLKVLKLYSPTAINLDTILKKNPRLKRLRLVENSMESLKIASERLPRLEGLDFQIPTTESYKGPSIQFESIESVSITASQFNAIKPKQIQFKHVEKLQMILIGYTSEWVVDFVKDIYGIKSFVLSSVEFNNSTLSKLSDNLGTLVQAFIDIDSSVDAECISKLLHSSPEMDALQFNCPGCETLFKDLYDVLDREQWIIHSPDDDVGYNRITIINAGPRLVYESDEDGTDAGASSIYASTTLIIIHFVFILKHFLN